MVECNCTPSTVYQQVGKDQCNESHDSCAKNRVSVFSRLQQIFHNVLPFGEANAHKHDGYDPVLLGGGSVMHIRSEPESMFREGK